MQRPLADADRARVRAFHDACGKAMGAITEYDYDKVNAALEAVAKAHPISQDLHQAYEAAFLAEQAEMAEPLNVLNKSRYLKPDAPWGLVVYRVSYSDDAAWDRMLSVIRQEIESSLAMRKTQPDSDLLSRHDLVVMDDRCIFEGASHEKIREHFNTWSIDELQRNWRVDHEPVSKDNITGSAGSLDYMFHAGPRYNFCFLVDDICLESIEHMGSPVVKLVNRVWTPESEPDEAEEDEEDEKLDWEGGDTNHEYEDVGWMYVEAYDYIEVQNYLQEDDKWCEMYVRPPLMRWESEFNRAPGFWRQKTPHNSLRFNAS